MFLKNMYLYYLLFGHQLFRFYFPKSIKPIMIKFKYHNDISNLNSVLTNMLDLGLNGAGTVAGYRGHVRSPEGTLKCHVGKT